MGFGWGQEALPMDGNGCRVMSRLFGLTSLEQRQDASALVRAMEGAASGLVVMDPLVVNSMKPRTGSVSARLTPRQQEVLAMMAQGYNDAAIAEKLVLGTKSVENYINAIYQELSLNHDGTLHPRVQAVLSYIRDSA